MGVAIGGNSYLGTAEEVTWGTPVTPDRFHEILKETLERDQTVQQSQGIRPGVRNLPRGSRRRITEISGKGGIDLEVVTTGMGRLFKHIMGVSSPSITQQGGSAAYKHVYPLGGLAGLGLTLQKVIRDESSTNLKVLTFAGAKVDSAEFKNGAGNLLNLTVNYLSKAPITTFAAASPSYGTYKPFSFVDGKLLLGGTQVGRVTDWTAKIDNKLKTSRYLGQGGNISEPTGAADFPDITGKLTIEFDDTDAVYAAYETDAALSLDILYEAATIASTYKETFELVIPEIHLKGDTPKIGGTDIVKIEPDYEAAATGSSAGATINYITTDTAA